MMKKRIRVAILIGMVLLTNVCGLMLPLSVARTEVLLSPEQSVAEASSPYQSVFEGGKPPETVRAGGSGVVWRSEGMIMGALSTAESIEQPFLDSTVKALSVAYMRYEPQPMLTGSSVKLTIHAEGGDGDYRYRIQLYYNDKSETEWFTTRGQRSFPFQANPVFTLTFDTPGYYMVQAYIADSSGSQLVWSDTKFLVTTPADYSNPQKVAGKVKELAAQCKAEAKTPYDRAKWMHDWLIYNADYDQSLSIYKPEGVLLLGTGVCDSYSRAYQMLLREIGIPCLYVSNNESKHAWNMVQLGGYWYHVDVTWDDPIGGGGENHDYFLVSDDFMRADEADGFIHAHWNDSAGQVPAAPYNWGQAPAGPVPAPTAVVNQDPKDITVNGLHYAIMDSEALLQGIEIDKHNNTELVIPSQVKGYPVRGILPGGLKEGNYVTDLRSLTLPEGLRSLSADAMANVRLRSALTIPASVTGIAPKALTRMVDATGFQVAAGSSSFKSQGGVLYSADMTRIVQYPAGSTAASFTLPPSVTHIDDGAFASCKNLKELHTSSPVLKGTVYAFENSNLTIYGRDGTGLQADIARYSNPPVTYVVEGGPVPLLLGDADGDGTVTLNDLASMVDHLLKIRDVNMFRNADMNSDGAITPDDLLLLIGQLV